MSYNQKGEDNILLVCYEDFVNRPHDQFKQICDFLDEPFEIEPITSFDTDRHKSFETHIRKEINPKTKKWEEFVSIEEAKYIETKLEKFILNFGYDKYTE